jgi:hypothetical protein
MNDTAAMQQLRNELLNKLATSYPSPLTLVQLSSKCRNLFLTKDKEWFHDAMHDQVKILKLAGLIRPFFSGYALTEKGRQDRNQAARFMQQPDDVA